MSTLNQMLRRGERENKNILSICNLSDSVLDPVTYITVPYSHNTST